jgi:hypothetical protein
LAIVPTWAGEQDLTPQRTAATARSEQTTISLPPFFDCSKYLGPGFPQRPDFPRAADLLSHLDRLGIDRAVAWHTAARDLHPMSGNEQLLREIEGVCAQDRIIPSFVIAPSMIDEPGVMDRFLDLVKTHRVRAFHFFKGKSGGSLPDVASVIQAILPSKPVLFLDSSESLSGRDKDQNIMLSFSEEFPQVSIIYTNAMWVHYKALYKLMEARRNIFVDTSLLHTYRTKEYILRRFGVERLIFGAGYKSNNGAAIASLSHAEISPVHAQAIAHGNLEQLLRIESPLRGSRPVVGDRLWHRLLRRERLGPKIIDAHAHLSRTPQDWDDHSDFDACAKHALRYMDGMGVDTMLVADTAIEANVDLQGSLGSKTYTEEHLSPYGGRFRGYFSALAFTPKYAEKLVPRLDEFFSRSYYIGFKMLNDYWHLPVTDPCFVPMWKYADAHALPILVHTWEGPYDAPKLLKDIAPRYPNAIFLLGHSGSNDRPDAEELAQNSPNVFLEWCGSFMNPTDWRETLERLGNRRLVYGSDSIAFWGETLGHDPAWEMGRLLSLDVPDETLVPILGNNMSSILARRR